MKRLIVLVAFLALFFMPREEAAAFTDVKKSDYFYEAVNWAQQEKIISGYKDGTFRPHAKLTHQQFVKMYTNGFDFEQANGNSYDHYYSTLEQYGIFFPYITRTAPIKRGEVAVLLAYANGKIDYPYDFTYWSMFSEFDEAAEFMFATGLSTGQNNKPNLSARERFGAENQLTRAQAITFLYRLQQNKLNRLAAGIHLYKEAPLFTEQPIRSYDLGNSIAYHVLEDGINLRLAITYKNYVIGGYDTEVGATVHGLTIGTPNQTESSNLPYSSKHAVFPKSGYYVATHIDEHEGNTLRAVSWWVGTPAILDITLKAAHLADSPETRNVAKIYRDLTNEFRLKFEQPVLEEHWALTAAAKAHSIDMATRDYFSHYTPEGLSPSDRVQLVEGNTEVLSAGENISAGYATIFDSHTGLINSLGHRNNLLNSFYTKIGYGVATSTSGNFARYYTTKFSH